MALAVIEARVCGRVFNLFSCYVPLVMCEYPSTAKVWHTLNTVSYTHLTLPTKRIV